MSFAWRSEGLSDRNPIAYFSMEIAVTPEMPTYSGGLGVLSGDTLRAAYQTLVSLMVIVGFLPYLYIFGSAWKAGKRISAVSGLAITLLAIVCSIAPTAEIKNVWLFEAKLAGGTLAVVASAWLVYRRNRRSAALSPVFRNNSS